MDRAQRVLSPVSHATRVLALFTEPEVGPFRDTSYQASRPAATRVAHSRIRLARQASSPSSPSRWHARPARQLLYVTGRPSWLADDQGQQLGAQASSGVITLAGYPRPPLTSSLVRRHPAHDRAQQVPPGQRPLAALGQDGAALAPPPARPAAWPERSGSSHTWSSGPPSAGPGMRPAQREDGRGSGLRIGRRTEVTGRRGGAGAATSGLGGLGSSGDREMSRHFIVPTMLMEMPTSRGASVPAL